MKVAGQVLDESHGVDREDRRDERIRGQREEQPRLPHSAQVGEDDHEQAEQRETDAVRRERRRERRDREDPCRDRDRHCEDVIRQQCGSCHETRSRSEVLPRDDVRAAARLVDADRLAVREDHDREQSGDRERERQDEVRGAEARSAHEHDERLLRGVRVRRERIGREDRQREPLRQQRLVHLAGVHGPADEDATETFRREWICRSGHTRTLGRAESAEGQDYAARLKKCSRRDRQADIRRPAR